MGSRLAVVMVAALLAAGRASAAEQKIVVEDGDARAEITGGDGGLAVALTVGEKRAEWKYADLELDTEETDPPVAKFVQGKGGRLLLVQTYSGGAHCCWSLLAFDTKALKELGPVLDSQSPIALLEGRKGCTGAAVARPVDRKEGKELPSKLFCLEGARFRAKGPAPR